MEHFDLPFNRRNKSDRSEQKTAAQQSRPKSLLEAFENVVELAEDSNLRPEFFEKAAISLRYVQRKLKLSAVQSAILAIFIDRSEDTSIRISEIARFLGCRTTRMLRMVNEIDALASLHYIKSARHRKAVSYRVPTEVLDAIRRNEPYVYVPESVENSQEFFDRFNEMMKEKDDNEVTYEEVKERVQEWLEAISDTKFARGLRSYDLGSEDRILFIFMAHLFVENDDDQIMYNDIEDLYNDDRLPSWVKNEFRSRSSDLFRCKLIENANEEGMARGDAFKLTEMAKDTLLAELSFSRRRNSDKGLILPDSLAAKKLIYNQTEASQVKELSSILENSRFTDVQRRLADAGMRPGFCCLFYGAPGTGKTETVYQLAKATGRSIMRVDVDKIKSCWVGESEKNIKKLFDRYRALCNSSELMPILLFNEADAVLGVRMEGASKAVDKMENSIQNIILQEMEALNGIMIATTNLTTNLDKAFERRFLYKIRFDRPTVEARAQIWQAMMPKLSDEYARVLGTEFDLSGGEIENIVRKHSVSAILNGSEMLDLNTLREICRHERIASGSALPRIGFSKTA